MSNYRNLLLQREEQNLSELKFYGFEPQRMTQSVMLDLRLGNGNCQAFSYSYMTKILFNPSEGIEIFVADVRISIIGRNLSPIYTYLLMHRLTYIQENPDADDNTSEQDTFIERIEISSLKDLDTL